MGEDFEYVATIHFGHSKLKSILDQIRIDECRCALIFDEMALYLMFETFR